ncbi:MAG TPA: class I SAM-dependent methyltransferase [Deltaproteobacteria bacterium]|nr:class I SAM-dependent methyltransferase [Deltaproteobacteria bacterium]
MESVTCDQCGGRGQRPYLTMEDHFSHLPGTFSVVKCTSCGLLYTNPRPTGDELRGLYATYYDGNSLQRSSTGFAAFIRQHPGILSLWHALCGQYSSTAIRKLRGNVLDIGCGTGDLLEQVRTKGCRAFGVEPNESSAKICSRKGFEVYTGSFEDLMFPSSFFDAVVLWHSIEHLSSPRNALAKIKRILKPGGHVLIWCPNADSSPAALFRQFWRGWHLPFHFYHFTPKTLTALAETAGFRVEKLRAVTPEFIFAYSLQAWMNHQKGSVSQSTGVIRLFRTFVARAMIALVFRIHDHVLKGKGEFLQVELVSVKE